MQLLGRLEIKSRQKIIDFLNEEHVGRIASIDKNGFPQVIPMNFVFVDDAVYMHSHPRGEKIENIRQNSRVGFEVDRELEFLPSYFTHPTDASQADTLYISVVIKGTGIVISDNDEKARALNALMEKYQPEGSYERLTADMPVVEEVAVIKVVPQEMRGKYKVGQHMDKNARISLAENILKRNSDTARKTLKMMGFEVVENKARMIEDPQW